MRSERRREKLKKRANLNRIDVQARKLSKVNGQLKALEKRLAALEKQGGPN